MKTLFQKKEEVVPLWYLIDAKGQVIGRLASYIAYLLMGKNEAFFSQHVLTKNYVIVINANEIILTGRKRKDKMYYHYTGYPGGLKQENYEIKVKKDYSFPLVTAVYGMLPKNNLRKRYINHLKVYPFQEHMHHNHGKIHSIDAKQISKKVLLMNHENNI